MDNNNSRRLPPRNHAQENNNNDTINNPFALATEETAAWHRPPIFFSCVRDNPGDRSILMALQIPRVPFVVQRRVIPHVPATAVTFGVVPLDLCQSYEDFMSVLRSCTLFCRRNALEHQPTRDNPVPGYNLWYKMTGSPVLDRTRVRFYTHSWSTFKTHVGLLVLENRVEELPFR